MNILVSKFFTIFLLVLFVFSTFLTLKTVSITYKNTTKTYLTHERTVKDILVSKEYPIKPETVEHILSQTLQEGMVIQITLEHLLRIQE